MKPHRFLSIAGLLLAGMGPTGTVRADSIQPATTPYVRSITAAGNSYLPVFSADGRLMAFLSHANNIVTNDDRGPFLDLFARSLSLGDAVLVSVSTNGVGGANNNIRGAVLSAEGSVAFDTEASNLAPRDNNGVSDIYLRRLTGGVTTLVSVNASGTGSGNGPSFNPLISDDGRFVVFESLASDLVTNDFNGTNDIFIRDLQLNVTSLVSMNADGSSSPPGVSHSPSISADGRFVAFISQATNLVAGVTNTLGEVYVRDVERESNHWAVASHLSSTWARNFASGTLAYYRASEPALSADGHYVTFKTPRATVRFDLQRPTNTVVQLYTNQFLSGFRFDDNPRLAVQPSSAPLALEPGGRYIVVESGSNVLFSSRGLYLIDWDTLQTNVVDASGGGTAPYYVTNANPVARLVVTNFGAAFPGHSAWGRIEQLRFSIEAQRLMILSDATNLDLAAGPTAGSLQLYSVDVPSAVGRLLSTNRSGAPGPNLGGTIPAMSPDGTIVAWETSDERLALDLNRAWDVFLLDLTSGAAQAISTAHVDRPAETGVGFSRLDPISISADGRRVAYVSTDSNLATNDINKAEDVFVLDAASGTNRMVRLQPEPSYSVSGEISRVGATNTAIQPVLSADGRYLAFGRERVGLQFLEWSLYWCDLLTGTNRLFATSTGIHSPPAISPDGRMVAYSITPSLKQDVYIYIYRRGTDVPQLQLPPPPGNPIPVSTRPNSGGVLGNKSSILPRFSPDGSWVVFQSLASDLLVESPVISPDYQLYARRIGCDTAECATNLLFGGYLGPTRLLSYPSSTNNNAFLPLPGGATNFVFSANSRYVAFESRTNRIYRHDLLAPLNIEIFGPPGAPITNITRAANRLVCSDCVAPSLNADGSLVAYESREATSTNILLVNLASGERELISRKAASNESGNAPSYAPQLSQDGRFVVFTSRASDLIAEDANRVADVFLRDRWNGLTHCLSHRAQSPAAGNLVSAAPVLAANGQTVAFQSFASDLIPGDYNDRRDVFVVSIAGPDTDGDGLDDELEMAYFNTLDRDGLGDFDQDGMSDGSEIRLGTNPADGSSVLAVLAVSTTVLGSPTAGGYRTTVITWRATPGQRYQAQYLSSLNDNAQWESVGAPLMASGTTASATHVVAAPPGTYRLGFYRVQALP